MAHSNWSLFLVLYPSQTFYLSPHFHVVTEDMYVCIYLCHDFLSVWSCKKNNESTRNTYSYCSLKIED